MGRPERLDGNEQIITPAVEVKLWGLAAIVADGCPACGGRFIAMKGLVWRCGDCGSILQSRPPKC